MHLSTECLQLEQTIVMPNSMTIELVPETERKKRPSNFGSFKESNAVPVVVSLPVSPTHLTCEHRHLRKIGCRDKSSKWQLILATSHWIPIGVTSHWTNRWLIHQIYPCINYLFGELSLITWQQRRVSYLPPRLAAWGGEGCG